MSRRSASPAPSTAAAGEEETLLQRGRIQPRANVRPIARRGMAGRTLTLTIEVDRARLGVARQHVLNLERRTQRIVDLLVDRVREVCDLRRLEPRDRRCLGRMPFLEERRD